MGGGSQIFYTVSGQRLFWGEVLLSLFISCSSDYKEVWAKECFSKKRGEFKAFDLGWPPLLPMLPKWLKQCKLSACFPIIQILTQCNATYILGFDGIFCAVNCEMLNISPSISNSIFGGIIWAGWLNASNHLEEYFSVFVKCISQILKVNCPDLARCISITLLQV